MYKNRATTINSRSRFYSRPRLTTMANTDLRQVDPKYLAYVLGHMKRDYAIVSAPYTLSGIVASAYVSAANTVTVVLYNPTVGAIDLASGTWRARVIVT